MGKIIVSWSNPGHTKCGITGSINSYMAMWFVLFCFFYIIGYGCCRYAKGASGNMSTEDVV